MNLLCLVLRGSYRSNAATAFFGIGRALDGGKIRAECLNIPIVSHKGYWRTKKNVSITNRKSEKNKALFENIFSGSAFLVGKKGCGAYDCMKCSGEAIKNLKKGETLIFCINPKGERMFALFVFLALQTVKNKIHIVVRYPRKTT